MIIYKAEEYLNIEEYERYNTLLLTLEKDWRTFNENIANLTEEEKKAERKKNFADFNKQDNAYRLKLGQLIDEAEKTYINKASKDPAQIMADAEEIVEAIDYQEDYIEYIHRMERIKNTWTLPNEVLDGTASADTITSEERDFIELYKYFELSYHVNASTYCAYLKDACKLQARACVSAGSMDLLQDLQTYLKNKTIEVFNEAPLTEAEYTQKVKKQVADYIHTLGLKTQDEEEAEAELNGQIGLFDEAPKKKATPFEDLFSGATNIETRRLDESIILNTKLGHLALTGKIPYGEIAEIKQGTRKDKGELKPVYSYCTISNLQGVETKLNITPYVEVVHNAIASLIADNQTVFTPQMLYRQMTANPQTRLTDTQNERINETMEALMYNKVTLDLTEEASTYKNYDFEKAGFKKRKQDGDKFIVEGPFINAIKVDRTINGTTTTAWQVLAPPILQMYAEAKNQIARIPTKVLNTPVNKDEDTLCLQNYLLTNIVRIKGGDTNNTILYESIYKELGAETDKKKQQAIRKKVEAMLKHFKETKFIRAYKIKNKSSIKYYSIEIIYN